MTSNPHLVPVTSKAKNEDEGRDNFVDRKCIYIILDVIKRNFI